MTRLAVTGATGQLGRIVIAQLLERGVEPTHITAVVRDAGKARDLEAVGVDVRIADYEDPSSLLAAFAGIDRLLLISSSEVGRRAAQHGNVISAALEAGVGFLAYTSILNADRATHAIAEEHQLTEQLLAASGLPHALLRNGWYVENYIGAIEAALATGVLNGAAGNGTFAPATRADYATAAAAVLAAEGEHAGATYELGGDDRITMSQLAAVVQEVSGEPVTYVDHDEQEYQQQLEQIGIPEAFAAMLASSDAGISRGELDTTSGDLARLIGRPTTTVRDALITPIAQLAVAAE